MYKSMIQNNSCRMTYFSFIYNFYNIALFVVCIRLVNFKKSINVIYSTNNLANDLLLLKMH